jgi:dipeptidyl aminopeptidase/acylaminoacyl peptidase
MAGRPKRARPTAADPEGPSAGGGQETEPAAAELQPTDATSDEAPSTPRRPRGRPPRSRSSPPGPRSATVRGSRDPLTVEQIVAVESPREFRLEPRGRAVAFVAEAAGARQIFTLSLRGGYPVQVTASEKHVGDPQWAPDGRRLAFIRDGSIWVGEVDGSRLSEVTAHPAGNTSPRWSPDGRRLAFLSRRRGWAQVWTVEAPVPRRGRPAANPKPPEPQAITPTGTDIDAFEWSPDGGRIVAMVHPGEEPATARVVIVDVASGREEAVADGGWITGATWCPDGSLLYLTDADGWFQVVRRSADGRSQTVLTAGSREHGTVDGTYGMGPRSSPDGRALAYAEFHDGLVDLLVASMPEGEPRRGRGRPPKRPRPLPGPADGQAINPWPGVWRAVGWLADGAWIAAIGESETRPQDLWLLPVPGAAPAGSRPRQVTDSLPTVVASAFAPGRVTPGTRVSFTSRDGLRIEGTLWRPAGATGRRGGTRVPTIVYPHGGPVSQALRAWLPFKQLLVREGFAFLDIDFRGSTGYGRDFRLANRGVWGQLDLNDVVDGAQWARKQPWSNGRLAIYGASYGGYLVLCALVQEPGLWSAGVDLYGDSEIAESYRHGDRFGRLDLHRQMGGPDDPDAADAWRAGSPVYLAERVEAPLLMLHGRKDQRVVPLMTERMAEALAIEGKFHEVVWYDDEAHGWEKRETKRDAFGRTLAFLKRHVLDAEG